MTPADPAHLAAIRDLVSEEREALRAFSGLLEREQQSLVDGDADRLGPIARDKSDLIARLGRFGLRRSELLSRAGFGTGREGIDAWLASLPRDSDTRRDWMQLASQAARAQELNAHNGALIRTRMSANQQALALLLSLSDQAALYGPDGQAHSGPASRHLGTC